jgi:hypothetical protein
LEDREKMMSKFEDPNHLGLRQGDRIRDHLVKRVVPLEGIRSFFYELEHLKTDISNKDAENTFSVAFKTVPVDSTGVAHILEHTVLCGSNRYPVRDPFFSMLKRSLSTFMNAFTASDWLPIGPCTPFLPRTKKIITTSWTYIWTPLSFPS